MSSAWVLQCNHVVGQGKIRQKSSLSPFWTLDEPTNHLDIRSREILLDALRTFTGTVLLVSHDRHFLRSLVNRVLEIDHGEMRVYEGDYRYYLEKTRDEATIAA